MHFKPVTPRLISPARLLLRVFVLAFLVTGAMTATVVTVTIDHLRSEILREQQSGQQVVAQTVQQTVDRALALGIPLKKLPGLNDYLSQMVERVPWTSGITIRSEGVTLAQLGKIADSDAGFALPLSAPALSSEVIVYRSTTSLIQAMSAFYLGALTISVATAALVTAAFSVFVLRRVRLGEKRLLRCLQAIDRSDFSALPETDTSTPADPPLHELRELLHDINIRYSVLQQQLENLRAIDFDGALTSEIDGVLKDISQNRRFRLETNAGGAG